MPSTVIRSFAYDPDERELRVVFQSGRQYTYRRVPPDIFASMKGAYAKGEFFNAHIRGKFPFLRDTEAS